MTTSDTTPSEQARQILQAIAISNPDYGAFQAKYADTGATDKTLPPELLQDTLSALAEDPNLSAPIETLRNNSEAGKSFIAGGEVATLIAVAFILRTHIKIKRNTFGKWEFLFEHKPGDSKLLSRLLTKLEEWMGGTGLS